MYKCTRGSTAFTAFLLILLSIRASAQVLLQGFYWDVPSPAAGAATAPWWWDHLAEQAHALQQAGFSAVWIPPVTKGASGGFSVGYDPFDDYDLGAKNQRGVVLTRYGTREQLERCAAMLRSNQIDCYLDLVENHRNGDPAEMPFIFHYADAFGRPSGGRFEKGPLDFHPNVPPDPNVPDDSLQFGRDLAHINGAAHHVYDGLIDAVDWTTRALDARGYRMDFMKGISTQWLVPFLNSKSMAGKFAVGEFWDQDRNKVESWVKSSRNATGVEGRASAFDFPLQHVLRNMCSVGAFDMRTLDHAGLAGIDPKHAVTVVENHDTDRNDGDKIVHGKMLAYAYILTSEGYPSVFYRDYSMDPGCYHLKPLIDPLIRIHEKLAAGPSVQRWMDRDIFVFERQGGRRLLVGLNRSSGERTVTVKTGFTPGSRLKDYAGHGTEIVTDPTGAVSLTVPANIDGAGYVCYAPVGMYMSPDEVKPTPTTQEYEGAADLDIPPATAEHEVTVCRTYVAAGSTVVVNIHADTAGWTADTDVVTTISAPDGNAIASGIAKLKMKGNSRIAVHAKSTGFYAIRVLAHKTPASNSMPAFKAIVTYTAPQSF